MDQNKKTVKIQRLENQGDLELLIRGDAVQIVYEPASRFGDIEENVGAYHGINPFNHFLQFLIPAPQGQGIIIYQAGKNRIELKDGKIVLKEKETHGGCSYPESRSYEGWTHDELNDTLVKAGLR
jgi:hypothetical protein